MKPKIFEIIKYKKVPHNENAIEIDGQVVLSFDPKYKEYLKWRDRNPNLEQHILDELEQELDKERLWNGGEPHKENNIYKWYDKDGCLITKSEMKNDKPHGIQWNYHKTGNIFTKITFINGIKNGRYDQWERNGNKELDGYLLNGKNDGRKRGYRNGKIYFIENYKNGKRNGLATYNTLDGKKDREGNYKDGKKEGLWVERFQRV